MHPLAAALMYGLLSYGVAHLAEKSPTIFGRFSLLTLSAVIFGLCLGCFVGGMRMICGYT